MGRLLLVGNSRWHWAQRQPNGLRVWHEAGPPVGSGPEQWRDLEAWACVGRLSAALALPEERRIGLAQVPLQQLPPWLGVDRALVGWRAWRCQGQAVLVADAGTCLSLTCVDGQGRFRGGRLSAGLALQLRSLGLATAELPDLPEPLTELSRAAAQHSSPSASDWPVETADAMIQGCLRACAAAVAQAWRERCSDDESWALWLTGGDATLLEPLLRQQGIASVLAPDLAVEALAELAKLAEGKGFSPDPGR